MATDNSVYDSHWAERTINLSVRRAVVGGAGIWQVVMVWAVLAAPMTSAMTTLLLMAHILTSVLAVLVLRQRASLSVLLWMLYASLFLDYHAAEHGNVLHFVTVVHAALIFACPGALLSRRTAVLITLIAASTLPAWIALHHPTWGASVPIAIGAMMTVMTAILLVAMPFLRAFARNVDRASVVAEREHQAAAVSRQSSQQAAEDARILHDTVINTLAAVANGAAATADAETVRTRCARDVEIAEALLQGRETDIDDLDGIIANLDVEVHRDGLAAGEWSRLEAYLNQDMAKALRGAVGEALRNAAKHASVPSAQINAQVTDGQLTVTVSDQGVGFDGHFETGRGLAESLYARARAVGIQVDLDTAVGRGTTVLFRCTLADSGGTYTSPSPDFLAPTSTTNSIVRLACWLMCVGYLCVELLIEPLSRPGQLTGNYGMIAINALMLVTAWLGTRRSHDLPTAFVIPILLSIPLTFLFAFEAVDFGFGKLNTWQPLGAAPPLLVLMSMAANRKPILVGLAVFLATIVITTFIIWQSSPAIAMVVPVGAAPPLGLLAGWYFFTRTLTNIIERSTADRRSAWLSRVQTAARLAADRARDRWRNAGTRKSLELLRRVAEGTSDPTDPETRTAAAAEEAYLRQLCLLSPDIIQLAPWFGRALSEARSRSVHLTLRIGDSDVDVPDRNSAAILGSCLLAAIAATPSGNDLTVSMFRLTKQIRFTLVGNHPHISASSSAWSLPPSWSMSAQQHGAQDLIEIFWDASES